MAFGDIEKRKYKIFSEKHYAGARANIEQKPYGVSLEEQCSNSKRNYGLASKT